MSALLYLGLTAVLAYHLRTRVRLLDGFGGGFRYLFALGLALFLAAWLNLLLYAAFGWGWTYLLASWAGLLLPTAWFSVAPAGGRTQPPGPPVTGPVIRALGGRWNWWFLFLFCFVLIRFYSGLDSDEENHFWSAFNFDDTPFHLSVANAFLNSPRFPPMDLDMAPYPLKYHFLADFWLAHLQRLGLRAVHAVQLMNCLSAAVMVGGLWAAFRKWLRLPAPWVMLACLIFLFLNLAVINVVHFLWFRPDYFRPGSLFDGLLLYPYFNFESELIGLFHPQRGLLFTFPIGLLILDACFAGSEGDAPAPAPEGGRIRILESSVLLGLLPFSHIVTFAVLACCLAPALWAQRRWLLPRFAVWLPAMVLGALQLAYLGFYGPSPSEGFSSWNVAAELPLAEFAAVPAGLRRALFWFFVDGDFLFWGALFAGGALVAGALDRRGGRPVGPLGDFLRRWRWYFAVCGLCFVGVNCYRYSAAWGDSNKFVLFLNFGLTMVIALGAAGLRGGVGRAVSRALWYFFFVLCVTPPAYRLAATVLAEPYGSTLLFHYNERAAARWLRTSTRPGDLVLTGAYGSIHFVSSLAGRPVLAGLYGDSNPYREEAREEAIRRVYEEGDLEALRRLGPRYLCVSRYERTRYRLNPCWEEFARMPGVLCFRAGQPDDAAAALILDARALLERAAPAGRPAAGR